jgi:hypothetical protein
MTDPSACREANWQPGGVHDLASLYTSDGAKNADVANGDVGVFIFGLRCGDTAKDPQCAGEGE